LPFPPGTVATRWREGDHVLAANILKIEKRFYDEHLSQWAAGFCDKVVAASTDPFYGQFSDVTKKSIEYEGETPEDQIDRLMAGDFGVEIRTVAMPWLRISARVREVWVMR